MRPTSRLGFAILGSGLTVPEVARTLGLSTWALRHRMYGHQKFTREQRHVLRRLFPSMMNLALPGLETETVRADDIILTPDDVARDVVRRFAPSGRVLDPCKGEGAFLRHMPGAEWCEIREGRDFFGWTEPVDWIVSNPPYSIFSDFLRHAFRVAQDIVFLIPVNKAFNSDRMMREIWTWGGIPTVYVVGGGGALGFPIGDCIGAVHFRRGYRDGMRVEFRIPNARLDRQEEAR